MYSVVCALFSLVEEAIQQIVFRTQWIIIRLEEGHSSPVVKTYNNLLTGIHRDPTRCPEIEFLEETQTKERVFLLAIKKPLQLRLEIFISSNSCNLNTYFYSSFTVHCKGERKKT
jgi:hypothetical protein